jgi:drug/metabolite transporter (DMT)-like permease
MSLRIIGAFAGAAFTWGTTGVATRAALNDGVPPIALTTIRAVIATVLLYTLMRATGRRLNAANTSWRLGWIMAAFNLVLPFVVITFAYRYASAGFIGFLTALIPLVTALLAHYMLPDEPLHLAKVAALTVALTGVALLLFSGDSGLAEGGRPLLAAGLAAIGVISIGYAGVYAKQAAATYDPITLTTVQFGTGTVLLLGLLAFEGIPKDISLWGWTLILYLASIGGVVPFLLYYWVLRHVSSTAAATIGYMVPLVALIAGIVLLDEQLQLGLAVGGMLILTGVVLTGRVERRRGKELRAGRELRAGG